AQSVARAWRSGPAPAHHFVARLGGRQVVPVVQPGDRLADAGFNTLLIDGDLRRGGLHRVLKGSRTPGLTDYLGGTATREAVIQTTPYPQLWFIGGGTRKQTAPELLGTPAMRELVLSLRSNYQVILIDSPPLGAAVDPFLLAT